MYHNQAPNAVVMIRPHCFTSNPQTMADNAFQTTDTTKNVAKQAYDEVTNAVSALQAQGVTVHVFEDTGTATPDSVFPNNWFSTHENGAVVLYPMFAENRRLERRGDIIEMLKQQYQVTKVFDYSTFEQQQLFLEGTGSMVLDHRDKVACAVKSKRTDEQIFTAFCNDLGYKPLLFNAFSENGKAVYHTNVLMCIATGFIMLGSEMITQDKHASVLNDYLQRTNKHIINLSEKQINQFCGNALELQGKSGRVLALSTTAYNALSDKQKAIIEQSATLLPLDIPTIESAGGSVRCMLAGIHLESTI